MSRNSEAGVPAEVSELTVAYHDRVVLQRASISLPAGQIMAVLGPNGAGKSTLLKASLGLIPKLSGEVRFYGSPLNRVRHRVGYMPQSAEVDWDFPATVRDVVRMGTYGRLGWLRRPGRREHQAVEDALATVGISDLADRQVAQLSGGQKQRTFLARILAQGPDLYIMDEPFAGVDAVSERTIVDVLVKLRTAGKTVLIVHHDLGSVKDFCSWVTLMNSGKVVASGPLEEAFTPPLVHRTFGFDDADLMGVR